MRSLLAHRGLIVQLARRDISQRYRSSVFGVLWVFAQPLVQLAVYSFVFQTVLRAKWGVVATSGSEVPFGLMLFIGLLMHALISETLVRGPALVTSQQSFVKRVIFPLQILPVVMLLGGLFNLLIGLVILAAAAFATMGHLAPTAPLVLLPVVLLTVMSLGLGWMMSALGVFVRDLNQLTTHLATILLFTAPVCYPVSMVPAEFRWLLDINPLTIPVVSAREVLFESRFDPAPLLPYAVVAVLVYCAGYLFFRRVRPGFADAI